jgi:serine protease Do
MGDSAALEIGEWVIAIGSPFGLRESLSVGIVSAKGRSNVQITDYEDFIQTDAAINPGNSGGPLLNIDGQVIGVNTAIVTQSGGYQGVGFAIPIAMAKSITDQLIASGKVVRGYLGIHIQEVTQELAESFGLKQRAGILIAGAEKGSPAEKAGLQQGDLILKLNGKDVDNVGSFRSTISSTPPGTEVTLNVRRDDKVLDVKIKTGTLPDEGTLAASGPGGGGPLDNLGLSLDNLTKDTAEQFGYALGEGVLVTGVQEGSAAAMAGIGPGNLITAVNKRRVGSVSELKNALAESRGGKPVLLLVRDGRFSRYVVLRVE